MSKTNDASIMARFHDSFVNFAARLGFNGGSQQDGSHYQNDYMSRNRLQMEAAYRTNWIAGVAVDTIAEDMTRAGTEITSGVEAEDEGRVEREMQRLSIWPKLQDTVKWSRLYGGAIAVLLVDGQDPSSPLRLDTVDKGQFKGLMVLDRWLVQPSLNELVTEYGDRFGEPKYYAVIADSMALARQTIHYSRVIRMEGIRLPYWQRIAENLWGQSVLERIWDRMIAFDSTTEGAAQLVYRAHLRTYKVKGLRNLIATGGRAMDGLVKQIELIRAYQQNEGMTLMDGDDEFESHQYTFAGLGDMMQQHAQQLSGGLQVPLVRLLGQAPAGLSSTGESDLRNYYDNVGARQETNLRPGVGTIYELVHRSLTGKPLPDDFSFIFRSLWQLSDTDKSTVARNVAETVSGLEDNGIIDRAQALRELRDISKSTGIFSSISDQDIEEAQNEPPETETLPPLPQDEPLAPDDTEGGDKPLGV